MEKQELTFGVATQTVCHRHYTEEYQTEAQTYLADAKANREMIASGEPDGLPRRTIPIPNLHDPDRRLIVDWPAPRYRGYTKKFDTAVQKVVRMLLYEKGKGRDPGLEDALLDECAHIAGAEQPVAHKHLHKHLYDRLTAKFFSADLSDALDIMLDGHLVARRTEFREKTDDKSGAVIVETPINPYNEEPAEQDDVVSIDGLSGRMVQCLDVESEAIKGIRLLPIALLLADGKRQVDIAARYGCDQSEISRAKREIRERLRANGYGK